MFDIISSAISWIWIRVLNIIASWLPVADISDSNFSDALQTIMIFGKQLGFIIPWNTLFLCLFIMLIAQSTLMTLKFIMWVTGKVIDKTPTGS